MKDLAVIVIGVFGLFHPAELTVKPAHGEVLTLRLAEMVAPFRAAPGDFQLSVPGRIERRFRGRLEVRADGGELLAAVTMDLETAVASVVAAESPPGASLEALKAQAVVARSFYVAARGRHHGFDFCDTTHCQFLRQPPEPQDPAWLAAAQTRGLILRYEGRALPAMYSANCGGRTGVQAQSEGYPYFEVSCLRKGERRGHGLGLCQEGGAAMARAGSDFRVILAHYYPNTRVAAIQ
jgi:peptidoglycan hydrolase-like amidase